MLKIENLSVSYDKHLVLNDINLQIEPGNFYSIIGVNGCGKTTLLNSIVNLINYQGNITLDNQNMKNFSRAKMARTISYFRQTRQNQISQSVYDIVMMARYTYMKGLFKVPNKNDKEIVEKTLKKLNLLTLKDHQLNTLSGGEKQRVFLAKALACEPKILLLDEPTNHLDLKYQIEIIDYIKHWLAEHNTTVIAVLHDLNMAVKHADKIVLLDNKKSYLFSNRDELITSPVLNEAYNLNVASLMKEHYKLWCSSDANILN